MKLLNMLAVTAALVLTGSAQADYLCSNLEQTVKVQTYQLTGEDAVGFRDHKAVAVLKVNGEKNAATGTVRDIPNRVGGWQEFSLTDANDAVVSLTAITTMIFRPCTRASCPDPVESISGKLKYQGVEYALQCIANNF